MVIFRENTQGLYIGKEHWVEEAKEKRHAESIAVVTEEASDKIIRAAFEYAVKNERKKVTLIHKANILKLTTGLFLEKTSFPILIFNSLIVDNMAIGDAPTAI